MKAVDVLRNRIAGIASAVRDESDGTRDLDWTVPLLPGTSPLGLTLWHLPRTTDWLLATIRGGDEVADGPSYDGLPDPDRFGFGTALSEAAAAEAAAEVDPVALSRYVDAVAAAADTWLASLSDDDLDATVPEFSERQQRRPGYCTEEALAQIAHLPGLSIGMLLLRPAISHQLVHLGEIDTIAQQARR